MNLARYTELKNRAAAKNIKTFGDVEKALGLTFEEMFAIRQTEDYEPSDALYHCEAAELALESLEQAGLI